MVKNSAKTFWAILIISVLAFTSYSFMFEASFKTMDDQFLIVNNNDIKSFENAGKIFQETFFEGSPYYRPMVTLSYMTEYHFFGLNPFFYNLVSVFLHIATAIVVLLVINVILKNFGAAFCAALLFAIHPIQVDTVSNVAGRPSGLCGLFSLSAFLFFVLTLNASAKNKKALFYSLSLIFFALALLSKESALMLPAILGVYVSIFFGHRGWRKNILTVLPFLALLFIYGLARNILSAPQMLFWPTFHEQFLGVVTFVRAVATYLRLFVLPLDLHFDRSRLLFDSLLSAEAFLTVLFFTAALLTVFQLRKKIKKEEMFFLLWFFIELIPVSQILPLGVQPGRILTAEHFLYTASIGIFVILVLTARRLRDAVVSRKILSKNIFYIGAVSFYAFLFLTAIQQNIYASSEFSMLKRSVECEPNNARVQSNLAFNYAARGFFKEAENHLRQALILNPLDVRARIGLGKALCDQGRYREGIAEYEKIKNPGKYAGILKNNLRLTVKVLAEKEYNRDQ